MDYFLYNGEIKRSNDLKFIEMVSQEKNSDECTVILVTPGGDPDAAYKMARYLQHRYEKFNVLISGFCKSAGTLFAMGAHELIFTPYGELGPLDVQMTKTDQIAGLESGLNISEAFLTLEERARDTYQNMISDILASSGGIISFHTASHAATEIVTSLYAPIFSQIDPEEVGSRSRAMRIGEDYGRRLAEKWRNLNSDAILLLSQTYSSHGFVIDFLEAKSLFKRVRLADEAEMELVSQLGSVARHPQQRLTITSLNDTASQNSETENDEANANGSQTGENPEGSINGFNPEASGGTQSPETI